MSEQFSIPTPGDVIADKYRVMEELGRGSYGVVFRARQKGLDRDVALKTLLPQAFLQPDIVQRFKREAQLISRLDHPNVIRLYDYGVDEGLLYMAVEFVDGETLQDRIDTEAPLPPEEVEAIVLQMLDALEYAHGEGIVHRDLKPDNIVLVNKRPLEGVIEEQVKILDFGIAKLIQQEAEESALKTLTQSGTVLGTPHYMSPENIVGDPVDYRADLYALGVILYEMLVGKHPFDAQSANAVMVRHLRDDPPEIPEPFANTGFALAIEASLKKQPFDRVQSATEMRQLLETEPQMVSLPEPEPEPEEEEPEPRTTRRIPALLVVALLGIILAVSVGWKVWYALADDDPAPVEDVMKTPTDDDSEEEPEKVVGVDPEPGGFVIGEEETEETLRESEDDAGSDESRAPEAKEVEPQATETGESEEQPTRDEDGADEPPPDSKTRPETADDAVDEADAANATVTFDISSTPSNANVTMDGIPVGYTPMKRQVAAGDDDVTIRISHIGYKHRTFTLKPDDDRTIDVQLEKDRIKLID